MKKKISIVSGTYNEAGNIEELCERIRKVFSALSQYDYEQIIIDNGSTDGTREILKKIAAEHKNIKVILNTRNFGVVRSGSYALLQARGDAVIAMVSDLQDPPELLPQFLEKWEQGWKMVVAIKEASEESYLVFTLRRIYYWLMGRFSEGVEQIPNFTGFGLYDQEIIECLREMPDQYPYMRGMLSEIGYPRAEIKFKQPLRRRGKSSNNFFSLFDYAMLGFVNYSRAPIRLATLAGLFLSVIGFILAVVYLVAKLIYWDEFQAGVAPILIGLFLFSSVQLFFIGIIGEYVGAIYLQTKKKPLIFAAEKLNFDETKTKDNDYRNASLNP